MASDERRVPSPVTTTQSPSLCLQATAKSKRNAAAIRHTLLLMLPPPLLLTRRIGAEHLENAGLPLRFFEGSHDGAIGHVPRQLDVKKIIPSFALHRTGLDGLQIDASL